MILLKSNANEALSNDPLNPLVTGKFFLDFWAQIYRTGVLYDQTDRVKGIFHEINLLQIFLQKTARPCRDLWSLGYKVPEH
jgi:hypothetical protein